MPPKVLVACPTSEHKRYCLKQWVEGVKRFTYQNYDVLLVDNSKDDTYLKEIKQLGIPVIKGPWFEGARDRIIASRNRIREKVLKEGYDYFFSLEQDVIAPPDAIQRLLHHTQDIVCGVVIGLQEVNKKIIPAPMMYVQSTVNPDLMWFLDPKEVATPQLIEIKACALGCVMIKQGVLKDIQFRYEGGFDDMIFCLDATNRGYKIYCDTTVKTEHHQKQNQWTDIQK